MSTNPQPTKLELLEDAYDTLKEKKKNSKHMNQIASDVSKLQNIEKQILNRCKDYHHYRGRGWEGNDPLSKVQGEKFPDRVTPTFAKLAQIIDDVYAIGQPEMLDVYLDAMKARGITITIDPIDPAVKDIDDTWQAIENMSSFQSNICQLADEINFGMTQISEDINFTPKNEFKKVLTFYEKKKEEKSTVDDVYQDAVVHHEMTQTAYTDVYDENLK